ncbi:MAG: hypothetical protein ACLQDV_30085 [Candidatus Binataceae bacterium]
MEEVERDFWIALGLWGASAVTVLGTGLFAIVEGSYWSGIALTLLGLGLIVYIARHLKGKHLTLQHALVGALILTWVFLGYDIYAHRSGRGEEANPLFVDYTAISGNPSFGQCLAVITGSPLVKYREDYDVAIMCGIQDTTIDRLENRKVAISKPFSIQDGSMQITVPYSKAMIDSIHDHLSLQATGVPEGQPLVGQYSLWYQVVLLPKTDCEVSDIHRLSDIPRCGGRLLPQVVAISATAQR